MAYAATAEGFPSSLTAAPRVVVLQRALLWLAGASSAIVFIEPSPYELVTLGAAVIFFATGLRLRLDFMPLVLLLFLVRQATRGHCRVELPVPHLQIQLLLLSEVPIVQEI